MSISYKLVGRQHNGSGNLTVRGMCRQKGTPNMKDYQRKWVDTFKSVPEENVVGFIIKAMCKQSFDAASKLSDK